MKKSMTLGLLLRLIALPALAWPSGPLQTDDREKVLLALRTGDYGTAIRLSRAELLVSPTDYELSFALGQALAFSKRYDEALDVLNATAEAFPGNADVLLLRARVRSWKKDYPGAEEDYGAVLKVSPGNLEAETGLAELASWQSDYAKASRLYGDILALNPGNADIRFRLGRVYLWAGNYSLARAQLKQAAELEQRNAEYRQTLRMTSARLRGRSELRYEYQRESFGSARGAYRDQNLALQLSLPKYSSQLILKYNQTSRYGATDERWGIELYPHLWKKAYGYFDLAWSSKALHFPRSAYQIEVYQGFLTSAEISFGFRRMNFAEGSVSQYLGTMGYYLGNYYAYWRWYYSRINTHGQFSWVANLRRYFSKDDYVFAGFGWGTKPYELSTIEDFRASQTWLVLGGFDWCFFGKLRLKLCYSWGEEASIRRQTLFLSTGYRF
jgi:YaiO family outer membrane protein